MSGVTVAASVSGADDRKVVRVQVPSRAPFSKTLGFNVKDVILGFLGSKLLGNALPATAHAEASGKKTKGKVDLAE